MATTVKFRIVAAVVVFTMLLGVYSAKFWPASETGTNFFMYYTAACLVRSNMSMHIYDVIDSNTNPQDIYAVPNTVFAQTAHAHGITRITLYIYPPTLADLIVPLTLLSTSAALIVWNTLDVLMILGLSVVLTRTLDMKFPGSTVVVAAAVLLFRPTLNNFHWGQVSIVLAFLLTVGFGLYVQGHKNIAALLFALAIAIKLFPIVIIIPLIAWRDWKCLRTLAVWGILLCLGLWAINGSSALNLYFLHQLPAMWGGQLGGNRYDANRSIGNIFFTNLGGPHPLVSSRALVWLARVASALILCYAGWLSRLKPGENSNNRPQFEIGMMFLLFGCCLSPYSWFYNWAVCAPVLVVFCKRVWDGRADLVETGLLIATLLSLSTTEFNMALVTPLLGIALGLLALYRIRNEQHPQENINRSSQLKPVNAS